MFIDELVDKCDADYMNNASHYVCGNCSHKKCCPGNCGKCLDEVHLSRGTNERKDYTCTHMMDYYVGRYMYAYAAEDKKAFDVVREGIADLKHIHMLSIGCGPSPDLFAILDYLNEQGMDKPVSYIGFEHNEGWKKIHKYITEIIGREAIVKYCYQDVFDVFQKLTLTETNVLMMQYLLSHVVYNEREEEIDEFFDDLVGHVIMKMEPHSYIVMNDINHRLARDRFDLLERKIVERGKIVNVHKYYFRYKDDMHSAQTTGGREHRTNAVDYMIDDVIRQRYETRTACRSVQHIIEVNDR